MGALGAVTLVEPEGKTFVRSKLAGASLEVAFHTEPEEGDRTASGEEDHMASEEAYLDPSAFEGASRRASAGAFLG